MSALQKAYKASYGCRRFAFICRRKKFVKMIKRKRKFVLKFTYLDVKTEEFNYAFSCTYKTPNCNPSNAWILKFLSIAFIHKTHKGNPQERKWEGI